MFSHNMKTFKLEESHLENKERLLEHLKSLENLEKDGVDSSTISIEVVKDLPEMKRMNDFYYKSAKPHPAGWFRTKVLGKLLNFFEKP